MKSLNHKKKIGTKKKQNGGENQDEHKFSIAKSI
jgi:hypothetical protein